MTVTLKTFTLQPVILELGMHENFSFYLKRMWSKVLTMLRLRENENNVCIFFMEKKLTSYLVPIIFFACPPIFLLPKLGMDWNMNSLTFLYFYASYNYSVKPILRENCLKWAIFHMKKKLSLYLSQNFFLPAHPSFFLLTSVLITCHNQGSLSVVELISWVFRMETMS